MLQLLTKSGTPLRASLKSLINKKCSQQWNVQQLTNMNRYSIRNEKQTKGINSTGTSYKLNEVQFVHFSDYLDQQNYLLESKYYNDSDEARTKFMENKMGLYRCVELKIKLEYIFILHDKQIYQQKKVNEMIKIAIKYMDNIKTKFDNFDDKKQQELVYFLRNIHELMEYMNILDLNLWRVYFETIVLVSKKKSYNYHFTILLNSIDKFCNRFYHPSCEVFKEKFVFRQEDLSKVISSKLINQLLNNMEKCPITDPNPKSFVLSMYYLSTIIWKVSKAPQILISGYIRTQFFLKYQDHSIKILPKIDIELAFSLYYSLSASGAINQELQTAFNNYFISKLPELKNNHGLQGKLIDIWGITGSGCQQIYDQIEPIMIEHVQKNASITQILRFLSLSSQTNVKVNEAVIKQILDILAQKTELSNQISNFQLENLFNLLIFFKIVTPDAINLQLIDSPIFNLMVEYMAKKHSLKIELGQSKESILDLKPQMEKMRNEMENQANGLKYDKGDDVSHVNNSSQGYKSEHLCTKSLVYWLSLQNLQDEFIIIPNYKIYLYELDLLVYSKKLQKFVAIEISGNNYTNADGSLVGKRQLKDRILSANGIHIKYFSVTDDNIYNNVISLEATRKVSRIYIAEQIFKLIEDSLGYQYPKIELKKKSFIKQSNLNQDTQSQQLQSQESQLSKSQE